MTYNEIQNQITAQVSKIEAQKAELLQSQAELQNLLDQQEAAKQATYNKILEAKKLLLEAQAELECSHEEIIEIISDEMVLPEPEFTKLEDVAEQEQIDQVREQVALIMAGIDLLPDEQKIAAKSLLLQITK